MTGAPTPIPLTLITGPTGAGKTRLINAALAHPAFTAAIAISNDDGATALIRPPPVDLGELAAAACLCCAGAGAFSAVLERLIRARDNHRIALFERLFVETSGTADPAALAGEVIAHPYLSKRFCLTGIVMCAGRDATPDTAAQRAAAAIVVDNPVADLPALFALPFDPARMPATARSTLYRLSPRR